MYQLPSAMGPRYMSIQQVYTIDHKVNLIAIQLKLKLFSVIKICIAKYISNSNRLNRAQIHKAKNEQNCTGRQDCVVFHPILIISISIYGIRSNTTHWFSFSPFLLRSARLFSLLFFVFYFSVVLLLCGKSI